jgi:hypothetical protein
METPDGLRPDDHTKARAQDHAEGHEHEYDPESECEWCRRRRPFDIPERLVKACIAGDVVIFAGAGVSTEGDAVLPWTLYSEVAAAVGAETDVPFPTAMTTYEKANGRPALLQKIKERFDYIDAFRGLRGPATRFHRQLSTLFYVKEIITTNWDTYFEEECGATPIVIPDDYAFWGVSDRKVFKLHGSMNNLGSIVATEDDYERCYESLREGVIGSTLKHLLATKTIVFVGYSFRDEDFARIYGLIREQLGPMTPRPFIVTADQTFDLEMFPDATVITTDAAYFVEGLKDAIQEATECLLPDDRFDGIAEFGQTISDVHLRMLEALPMKDYPLVVYAASYQDGLMDALGRILTMRHTGSYSHKCDVERMAQTYEKMRKKALRAKDYWTVAYIEGYQNGMFYLLIDDDDREDAPVFHVFGADGPALYELDAFRETIADGQTLHKTAFALAKKMADRFKSRDIVPHHPPILSGLS